MVLFALFAAQETAKAQKTKALIGKLDSIIKAKYETYKTRRVPINIGADTFTDSNGNGSWDFGEPFISDWNGNGTYDAVQTPLVVAKIKLDCLHDLMRMELPDRWTDIDDNPVTPLTSTIKIARPAVSASYLRRKTAGTASDEFQYAECLYMIIMATQQEDADDRSAFKADQIKDTDGDGFPEIVDAWDQPIRFLRWAPGFISELQTTLTLPVTSGSATNVTSQSRLVSNTAGSYVGGAVINDDPAKPGQYLATAAGMARIVGYTFTAGTPGTGSFDLTGSSYAPPANTFYVTAPDPFDPRGVYPTATHPQPSFALYPLIYSGGPNKCTGVLTDFATPLRYTANGVYPFFVTGTGEMVGTQKDLLTEANFVPRGWIDNIHNHMITAR